MNEAREKKHASPLAKDELISYSLIFTFQNSRTYCVALLKAKAVKTSVRLPAGLQDPLPQNAPGRKIRLIAKTRIIFISLAHRRC